MKQFTFKIEIFCFSKAESALSLISSILNVLVPSIIHNELFSVLKLSNPLPSPPCSLLYLDLPNILINVICNMLSNMLSNMLENMEIDQTPITTIS